jgi:hypothetical protein
MRTAEAVEAPAIASPRNFSAALKEKARRSAPNFPEEQS